MRIRQLSIDEGRLESRLAELASEEEDLLVLAFGGVARFADPVLGPALRRAFPHASIVGCTTAGEITCEGVADGSLTLTTITFGATKIRTCCVPVPQMIASEDVGRRLGASLVATDLKYVLVLSDGVCVNGAALVKGLRASLGPDVSVSGGLAGDGGKFERTLLLHDGEVQSRAVVAVGFYGQAVQVRHGCVGGWTVFGPRRTVTKVHDNVVYELDGRPILDMYDEYLGDEAKDLPGSGLLYPLAMLSENREETGIIRTLLAINREEGSVTFAGDIEEGRVVQLMYAQDEQLIEGAAQAAAQSRMAATRPDEVLALLISCVGRKLLLGGRTSQEVHAAVGELGRDVTCTGFYSNGEISPFASTGQCELHNETMTITTLCEAAR